MYIWKLVYKDETGSADEVYFKTLEAVCYWIRAFDPDRLEDFLVKKIYLNE